MNETRPRFSQQEFLKAYDLIKANPLESCIRLHNYIEKYPRDYSAYPHYITTLIKLRRLDEAKDVYDFVTEELNNNPNIIADSRVFKSVAFKLLKCKAKILAYEERYDELFSLYNNNIQEFANYSGSYISFVCRVKLNLLPSSYTLPRHYLFAQTFEYSEERFLENTKKNLYSENSSNPNCFDMDFPFQKLYPIIKENLQDENILYLGIFEDFYIFQYDNCGKYDGKETDYFAVICFHGTKDIITIKPFDHGRYLPRFDLNCTKDDGKGQKTIGRIEKFKKRYGFNE